MDRFVRGLGKATQRSVLLEDPTTFEQAMQIAERVSRLDAVLQGRFNQQNKVDPYFVGGFLPSDQQMALLDQVHVQR